MEKQWKAEFRITMDKAHPNSLSQESNNHTEIPRHPKNACQLKQAKLSGLTSKLKIRVWSRASSKLLEPFVSTMILVLDTFA